MKQKPDKQLSQEPSHLSLTSLPDPEKNDSEIEEEMVVEEVSSKKESPEPIESENTEKFNEERSPQSKEESSETN